MTEGPTQLTAMLLGHGNVVSLDILDHDQKLLSVNMSDEAFVKAVRGLVRQAKSYPDSVLNAIAVTGEDDDNHNHAQ